MDQPAPPAAKLANLFGLATWSVIAPLPAVAALLLGKPETLFPALVAGLLLAGAIMAAVYHAEVLAH